MIRATGVLFVRQWREHGRVLTIGVILSVRSEAQTLLGVAVEVVDGSKQIVVGNRPAGCGQLWGNGDIDVYVHSGTVDNRPERSWTTWDVRLTTDRCRNCHRSVVGRWG